MSGLISRQAAIDAIEITPFDDYGDYMRSRELIEQLPSAQPEIIRCKDCEHCADDWNGNQPMFTCELGSCGESVMPNDYCSRAERKEE